MIKINLSITAKVLKKELTKHRISIKGTKIFLVNELRKLYSLPPLTSTKQSDNKYMIFLKKKKKVRIILKTKTKTRKHRPTIKQAELLIFKTMSNHHLDVLEHSISKRLCNDTDFYTGTPCEFIPKCYRIEITVESGHGYMFDIRSLNKLLESKILVNPYTQTQFTSDDILRIYKKISFLRNIGLHTMFYQAGLSETEKFEIYVTDVFSKLYLLNYYVHASDFMKISFSKLKSLYYEVYDIWNYRIGLSLESKLKIVENGIVFGDWINVKNMKPNNLNLLRTKILQGLHRLISEGETTAIKYQGATYFMLGYVLVSEEAAIAAPHLYDASSSLN